MTDVAIPTYINMMLPTLQAIDRLGGSGTKEEIDETVTGLMSLTEEQMAVEIPPESVQKGSKVVHRLAWARTYLKKVGALTNSRRGVWTLERDAQRFLDSDPATASAELRRLDGEVRKAARKRDAPETPAGGTHLAEDNGDAIDQDDSDTETADWSSQLLALMMALTPDAFERLARRLLREAGFQNVEVTGRSGDNGIDGVGVYRPSLVSFPIYFQCKKYAKSVGSSEVRDFRGAMTGRGEKGLLITTGTFTAAARKEATRDGAPLVDLVDGAAVCELLKEYGVGVRSEMVEHVYVESSFFDTV